MIHVVLLIITLFATPHGYSDYAATALLDTNFINNPYLTAYQRDLIEPHLLPLDHPCRAALDLIFSASRVTANRDTLIEAGFEIFGAANSGSYVTVARHPAVPGFVFKLYLDSEKRTKKDIPHCEWLARRCIGAKRIRKIIQKKKIRHFVVPDKWIYVLPIYPLAQEPHPEPIILLATEMDLENEETTKVAWQTKVTRRYLDELYAILKHGCGTTALVNNTPYTKQGQFAFTDTEYPKRHFHLEKVKSVLSKEMQHYWDTLIEE